MTRPYFAEGPHGSLRRYRQGCRCTECRASNAQAKRLRAARALEAVAELGIEPTVSRCVGVHGAPCPRGRKLYKGRSVGNLCAECRARLVWNGPVPAERARVHLLELSRQGVGRKSVAAATDISKTSLDKIISGRRTQILASTERRILQVDLSAAADRALIDAGPTWRRIRRLMRVHGFTKAEISRRIGQDGVRLQLGKRRVTVRNAHKIERLLADAEGAFLEGGSAA